MAKRVCSLFWIRVWLMVTVAAGIADFVGTLFVYRALQNANPFVCWSARRDSYCGQIPVDPIPPYPFSPKDVRRDPGQVYCSVHDSDTTWTLCNESSSVSACLQASLYSSSMSTLFSTSFLDKIDEDVSKKETKIFAILKMIFGGLCILYSYRDYQKDMGTKPQARDDPSCWWHGCKCCCRMSVCCITQYFCVLMDVTFAVIIYMLSHGFFSVDCDNSVFSQYKQSCKDAKVCGVNPQGVVANPEALQRSSDAMLVSSVIQAAGVLGTVIKSFCCVSPAEYASKQRSHSNLQSPAPPSSLQLTAHSQSFHVPAPAPAQYAYPSQPVAVPQAYGNPYTVQSVSYPMQTAYPVQPSAYPMQPTAPGVAYYPQMQPVQLSQNAGQPYVYVRASV